MTLRWTSSSYQQLRHSDAGSWAVNDASMNIIITYEQLRTMMRKFQGHLAGAFWRRTMMQLNCESCDDKQRGNSRWAVCSNFPLNGDGQCTRKPSKPQTTSGRETSFGRMVQKVFRLNYLGVSAWLTSVIDRRTDGYIRLQHTPFIVLRR